jgi:thiamine biosynthesis lipoprotein
MRKKVFLLGICLLFALLLCGCRQGESTDTETSEKQTAEVFAMDTIMDLTVYGDNAKELLTQAREWISRYENLFSVNVESSDVAKINAADGKPVEVSDDTYELIQKSLEVSRQTDGLFDISVYPLVCAWGFTTDEYRVPDQSEIAEKQKLIDYKKIILSDGNKVQIASGMEIDLGGIAKGYLSQKLMELFREGGATAAVISLGGNVQTMGEKPDGEPFVVGIANPQDSSEVYGTMEIGEKAVITSGAYQRYFEQGGKTYHHIMDVRTGEPAESDLGSVTVISDEGETADALATALYVMGKEKAIQFAKANQNIQLVLIDKQNEVWTSDGIVFEKKN